MTKEEITSAQYYNKGRAFDPDKIRAVQRTVGAKETGLWDSSTILAIAQWQQSHALAPDGKVGPVTEEKLYSVQSDSPQTMHPLPSIKSMWGYDHCPDTYNKPCPAWHLATSMPTFNNGLFRLVSGADSSKDRFSRSPDSWISLDELSIGFAHWWAETAPTIFSAIATTEPILARHAWGEVSGLMKDIAWLRSKIRAKRGKRPHQSKYDWLLAGWWEIAQHPRVVSICAREWISSYVPPGMRVMKEHGWTQARTLAGIVRITNSRGEGGMRSIVSSAASSADKHNEVSVMERAYSEDLYGHHERWEAICSMPHFVGEAPSSLSTAVPEIKPSTIERVDGTVPKWLRIGMPA